MFFFLFFRNVFHICNKCISLKLIYLNYIHFFKAVYFVFFNFICIFLCFSIKLEKNDYNHIK